MYKVVTKKMKNEQCANMEMGKALYALPKISMLIQKKILWALRKISMGIEILRNGRRNRFV